MIRYGVLNCFRSGVYRRLHLVLLASQVCELSKQSRLSFRPVFFYVRNESISVPPTSFSLVELVEFDEAVDLLRNSGVKVPVVIAIFCESLQIGFELLIFC